MLRRKQYVCHSGKLDTVWPIREAGKEEEYWDCCERPDILRLAHITDTVLSSQPLQRPHELEVATLKTEALHCPRNIGTLRKPTVTAQAWKICTALGCFNVNPVCEFV